MQPVVVKLFLTFRREFKGFASRVRDTANVHNSSSPAGVAFLSPFARVGERECSFF